ncbi:MAG TPA: bifunctional demethylmenaquinone methyltransferase/2-methoxy-6-polyprenyl-1,4-benzoquinol methylase UbiE [Nitrospiria bacterium]|nr:bifunctional demethylmenaquinone methyltransferase/2-methoxy-6-polyprenyl-1,4-benzoquinol methylase UbiE [Nitrospiria bacterium]
MKPIGPSYSTEEFARDKEAAVQRMFTSIARFYDCNNTLLSLGLHHLWKRLTVEEAALKPGDRVIDVGAGTFDLALRALPLVREKGEVVAIDLNEKMLRIGRAKAERRGSDRSIQTVVGSAESIPFPDNAFDAALTGFCLRNVSDLPKAAREICRVLKPGGKMACLEFSRPTRPVLRRLYDFYSFTLLPGLGTLVSRDQTGVYRYLPDSIRKFPDQASLTEIFLAAGFKTVRYRNLSGGIVAIHVGIK